MSTKSKLVVTLYDPPLWLRIYMKVVFKFYRGCRFFIKSPEKQNALMLTLRGHLVTLWKPYLNPKIG